MTKKTRDILTLSQPGGGSLDIHPDEWPALVQAVKETLKLDAEPAVSLDDLPASRHYANSPLKVKSQLSATLRKIPLESSARRYSESLDAAE